MRRAFRFRFYPSEAHAAELSRTFGCVRKVYNLALQARSEAWTQRGERVGYEATSALLTAWKRTEELAFLNEVSAVPLQQALRHLQTAFGNFWAKRTRFPRFKSRKKSRASAEYTRSAFRWRDGTLTLAEMREPLDIRWSRPLPEGAVPSTVTVSRDPAGRWFVSLLCEDPSVTPLPAVDAVVGIDVGLDHLLVLSTGEKVGNPGMSAGTGNVSPRRSGRCAASRRVATTGPRPASRSPACTPGSPTGGRTFCTRSPLGSCVKPKRS